MKNVLAYLLAESANCGAGLGPCPDKEAQEFLDELISDEALEGMLEAARDTEWAACREQLDNGNC